MTRRELRQHLPAFAHLFGIKPWEIEDLTLGELKVFMDELAAIGQAQRQSRRDEQRAEHRKQLGLGPPPSFRHRSR